MDSSKGRPVFGGGYQPWGGACTCVRCTTKEPRDGFFRSSNSEHDQTEYDREQTRQWIDSRIEPSKLDEAEMRLRNEMINRLVMDGGLDRETARLRIILQRTRELYPENKHIHALEGLIGRKAEISARKPMEYAPSDPETLAEMRDRSDVRKW